MIALAPVATDGGALDRLDARTRLLAAFAVAIVVSQLSHPPAFAVAAALAVALLALSGAPLRAFARRLLHVEGFLLVLTATLPFVVAGRPLFALGPFVASVEGAARAVALLVKVNVIVVAVQALIGALEPVATARAAARLGLPAKLAHLVLFAIRYVGLIGETHERLRRAMAARAFVPRAGRHGWAALGELVGLTLLRAADRAERVALAMRARGFDGRFHLQHEGAFAAADAIFGLALVAALATALALEFAP